VAGPRPAAAGQRLAAADRQGEKYSPRAVPRHPFGYPMQMGKLKKMKKLSARTRRDGDRAERAAERAESAHRQVAVLLGTEASLGGQPGRPGSRPPIYTGAAGLADTPPVAAVKQ
jgi:hypothetical protein